MKASRFRLFALALMAGVTATGSAQAADDFSGLSSLQEVMTAALSTLECKVGDTILPGEQCTYPGTVRLEHS